MRMYVVVKGGKAQTHTISETKQGAIFQFTGGMTEFWKCEVRYHGAKVIPIDVTITPIIDNVNDIKFEEGNG